MFRPGARHQRPSGRNGLSIGARMRSEPARDRKEALAKLAFGLLPVPGSFVRWVRRRCGAVSCPWPVMPRFCVLSGWERQHSASDFWGDRAESASPISGNSASHRGFSDQSWLPRCPRASTATDRRSTRSLTRMALFYRTWRYVRAADGSIFDLHVPRYGRSCQRIGQYWRLLVPGSFVRWVRRRCGAVSCPWPVMPRFCVLSGWERQHSASDFWGDRAESASPISGNSASHRGFSDQSWLPRCPRASTATDRRSTRSLTRMAACDAIKSV